ncbi:sulfurtransferase [Nocardioides sp. Iso805N]|uniref:sulfurtransferase n=1 Tax=Nocardioides sp. Iso805N TaxID=1283287 RepID=UPI000375AFB2|nr:sulfurtransferase [Nocardioides sp. Iso805N]
MAVLITATELAAALDSSTPPVVLDVRWRLTVAGGARYDGHADYLSGHIPGAVFVDLDTELAGHGPATEGRHPLPTPTDFQAAARRWGVEADSAVVVHDGEGNLAAARAWWLLRWAGLSDVRLLDGALPAWVAEGRPLDNGEVVPAPGSFTVTPGSVPTIDADTAATWASQGGVLIDARAAERYRGETEPIDPKAGHVPGALNAPTGGNLADDGRFRSPADLLARFTALGVTDQTRVAAYCGSGVTAAHEVAALAIAGFEAALYPGSWSQWSNQDRPVATGPSAG